MGPLGQRGRGREHEYGITPIEAPEPRVYAAMVLAVAHKEFVGLGAEKIREFGVPDAILYDVKYLFPPSASDGRL